MYLQFLTFVLVSLAVNSTFGLPSDEIPPSQISTSSSNPKTDSPLNKELLQTSLPNETTPTEVLLASRVYRESAWSVGLGLWSGTLQKDFQNQATQVLSLSRLFYAPNETSFELEARVIGNGLIGAQGQYRSYCCLGEKQEPFWTVGLTGTYKPSELMVGFIKTDSYQLLAGGGLENFLWKQRTLRIESYLSWGLVGLSYLVRLNYLF